jgi:hypothetical protein
LDLRLECHGCAIQVVLPTKFTSSGAIGGAQNKQFLKSLYPGFATNFTFPGGGLGTRELNRSLSDISPFSISLLRVGRMPTPQENLIFVEQASCLFLKNGATSQFDRTYSNQNSADSMLDDKSLFSA